MTTTTWLLGSSLLLGAIDAGPGPAPTARSEYESARAAVGRDADAHVRLALWCESRGLGAEKVRHLAIAVLADPSNAAARGLLGLVSDGDAWRRPAEVERRAEADETARLAAADYVRRRAQTPPDSADAQMRLAAWCEARGLRPEATAHYSAVVRLDPTREAAWRKLGCKRHRGRWLSDEQIAAEAADRRDREAADKHWQAEFESLRMKLGRDETRAEAEAALGAVADPRAAAAIRRVFGRRGADDQARAARMLDRIGGAEAARLLAEMALFARDEAVRSIAADALARRDPNDAIGPLVDLMREPVKYHVQPVRGPGQAGSLVVEGPESSVRRTYSPPKAPVVGLQDGDVVEADSFGLPVIRRPDGTEQVRDPQNPRGRYIVQRWREIPIGRMMAEAFEAAIVARKQLEADALALEKANAPAHRTNGRAVALLRRIAGAGVGPAEDGRDAWRAWWADQRGYSVDARPRFKPTRIVDVPIAYEAQSAPLVVPGEAVGYTFVTVDCFAAGTPVRTLAGLRSIELVAVGDRVLTQDPATGALSYQPVLRTLKSPPAPSVTIRLGGEAIVATGIHRFWVAGAGWTMARDLEPGDPIRVEGGTARVESVAAAAPGVGHNLVVAGPSSYFVGRAAALVHDHSPVVVISRPFDAPAPSSPALTAR